MNIMRENIKLIKMISDLRAQVKELKTLEKNTRTEAKMRANKSQMMQESQVQKSIEGSQMQSQQDQQMIQREIDIKNQYIEDLRKRLIAVQQENHFLQQDFVESQQMAN